MKKFDCPHCKGSGSIELESLSGALRECLDTMVRIGPATRAAIHSMGKNKTTVTATHLRVRRLEALGFVKRVGKDRPAVYAVV